MGKKTINDTAFIPKAEKKNLPTTYMDGHTHGWIVWSQIPKGRYFQKFP